LILSDQEEINKDKNIDNALHSEYFVNEKKGE